MSYLIKNSIHCKFLNPAAMRARKKQEVDVQQLKADIAEAQDGKDVIDLRYMRIGRAATQNIRVSQVDRGNVFVEGAKFLSH